MDGHAYTAPSGAAQTLNRQDSRGASPLAPLSVAALCVAAMAAVWALAAFVPAVHIKDAEALYKFTTLAHPGVDKVGEFLLRLLAPGVFILWGIALVAVAIAERRPRTALAVTAMLTLGPLSADLLKPLLAHSHDRVGGVSIGPASWPSGHATAAGVLAVSAVLVAPPALRRAVALAGGVFVLAVDLSLLVLAWHMPSDVLGGILLAGLWMALAVAALRASERVRPRRPRQTL